MDFLLLMCVYVILCSLTFFTYVVWERPWMRRSSVAKGIRTFGQLINIFTPPFIKSIFWKTADVLIYRRNNIFQIFYVILVAAGHLVLVLEVLPTLYHYSWNENHVFSPILYAFINAVLYVATCLADPGVVTERNIYKYSDIYQADGILYRRNQLCSSCNHERPARTKHCRMNFRFFLGFCLSLLAMTGNASWMCFKTLLAHVENRDLWRARYVDDNGEERPITARVLFQHLFMAYPLVTFLACSLALISITMSLYSIYILYLLITNQTTNERYKLARIRSSGSEVRNSNPFDKGFSRNLREAFQPHHFLGKDRVYRTKWR